MVVASVQVVLEAVSGDTQIAMENLDHGHWNSFEAMLVLPVHSKTAREKMAE